MFSDLVTAYLVPFGTETV